MLCTFKLHLAAFHLPDQVRACGAAFFCLEYWIERMVQLFKRMIKYRSTAYPELLFIHDYLLFRACLLLLRTDDGAGLISLEDALEERKVERRRRRRPAAVADKDDVLCGAPRELNDAERELVLPAWDGVSDLAGLPYLLYSDKSLHDLGWPTARSLPDGRSRQSLIVRQLGLSAAGRAGLEDVYIKLMKHVRASLPVGDAVSSAQCQTQHRKDNSWCFVEYISPNGDQLQYVGHLQFFAKAQYTTDDGLNTAPACLRAAEHLRLAVVKLYECECEIDTPGVRSADPVLKRPPEFIKVCNHAEAGADPVFPDAGTWVVAVDTLCCQLVPTRAKADGQYFMWANKASGRTSAVRLH